MNPRDQFIQEFVKRGKESGATKEQVAEKLKVALPEFEAKLAKTKPKQPETNVLDTATNFLFPKTKEFIQSPVDMSKSAEIQQQPKSLENLLNFVGARAKETILPAVQPGLEVAPYLIPGGAGAGKVGATIGAIGGVNKAIEAQSPQEAVLDVLGGTAFGYAAGKGTELAGNLTKGAGEKINQTIQKGVEFLRKKGLEQYATTFKDNATAQKIITRSGGPEKLAQEFINNNIPKTKGGVERELSKLNSQYETKVTNVLKTLKQTRNIDVDKVLDEVIKEGEKIYQAPGGGISPTALREFNDFKNYLEAFRGQYVGPKSNINIVNEFRKYLDQSFSGKIPSNVVDGEKLANDTLANILRRKVQEGAPITKQFFNRYSLLKKAQEIFYKEPKAGLIEGVGALAGGIPGAVASRVIKSPGAYRTVTSAVAGQSAPSGLQQLLLQSPTVNKSAINAKPYVIPAISALQRIMDKENQQNQSRKMLPGSR